MTSRSKLREIRVHVKRVAIVEGEVVVLVLGTQTRGLQVYIGWPEALAIVKAWRGWETHRPITTEVLANALEATGNRIAKFVLAKIEDNCFYGELHLKEGNKPGAIVDCRPSDGVAAALVHKAPLYINVAVMDRAAVPLADAQRTGEDFVSGVIAGSIAHKYWVQLLGRLAESDAALTLKLKGRKGQLVSQDDENVIHMSKRDRTFEYMAEYICNAAGLTEKRTGRRVQGTVTVKGDDTAFKVKVSAYMPKRGLPKSIRIDARRL